MANELAFLNEDEALQVAAILMRNDYCVLLSKEENLTIINYEWSPNADRNGVTFMNAVTFNCDYVKVNEEND